jgi:hypothetical protein
MAKKGKKNRSQSHLKDLHRECFTALAAVSLAAGVNTFSVSPNTSLSTRLADIADTYSLYRVTKLRFRLHRVGTIGGTYQVACYCPGVTDNRPSNTAEAGATLHRSIVSATQTVPGNWAVVPRQVLHGMQDWYKTVVGTPDAGQEVVGIIQLVGTLTETISLEVSGEFEFMSPIDASNTPAMQMARKIIHDERVRLAREAARKV